ncbi:MAG TPA: hypothetical protein VFI42_12960 [Thermomicrobiaceae bacterium]|nr:hypothetical protein [Thermomicrobiaceae bacterium]
MATTLAALVVGGRTAANAQVDGAWSQTEWESAINRALEAFWVDCLAINQTLRVSSTTLTITSTGTPYASLPADFMSALRLFVYAGTSQQREVFRSGAEDADAERTFRIEGSNLYIDPFERSVGSYLLRYNPLPTALSSAAPPDQVDLDAELSQHREYFELHAAIAYLSSEQESISDLAPRFAICQQRALDWAARQRSSQPSKIRDVRPRRFIRWV